MSDTRPRLDSLTPSDLAQIETTAYRLLEEVGIVLRHAGAVERLHGLGCRIDGGRVYVPPDAVRWGLEHITPYRTFYSADGLRTVTVGDGQLRCHNAGGPAFIVDRSSGQLRPAVLQDIAEAGRVLDALPNVDVVIPPLGAQDVSPELMTVASVDMMLRHTRKPVFAASAEKPADVRYLVAQAVACVGSEEAFRERPTTAIMVSPVSPLTFTEQVTATIMAVAESGAGFMPLPAPSLGATGPITLAGTLAQQHAESLAAFLLAAATRPGTPVMYCSRISTIDLRTAVSIWGGPEVGATAACAAQLAHNLGLACDAYGLASTSSLLDPQFAYERLANALVPALAGVDLMSGVGILGNNLVFNLEAAVIDDEILSLIRRIVTGIPVDDATLAFDLMAQVIPAGDAFLAQQHTVQHMRAGAVWRPTVGERPGGRDGASLGVVGRAAGRVAQILAQPAPECLPPAIAARLDEIMIEARRELAPD
jgi:trimethylamine---corrinoid protein Co-methyltransferase